MPFFVQDFIPEHAVRVSVLRKDVFRSCIVQDKEPIGFKNHGSVHVPEGGTVAKVWYQTKKGGWASYSQSDLTRMIKKNTGSDEWKQELQSFVNKLEEYKNNQS